MFLLCNSYLLQFACNGQDIFALILIPIFAVAVFKLTKRMSKIESSLFGTIVILSLAIACTLRYLKENRISRPSRQGFKIELVNIRYARFYRRTN